MRGVGPRTDEPPLIRIDLDGPIAKNDPYVRAFLEGLTVLLLCRRATSDRCFGGELVKAAVSVWLAMILAISPAFCCCTNRALARFVAAPVTSHSQQLPEQPSSKRTCCHAAPTQPAPDGREAIGADRLGVTTCGSNNAIPTPSAPPCCCSTDRLDLTSTASQANTLPEVSTDWLPLPGFLPAVSSPEHADFVGGLDPPERSGVDARSAALFERHIMRC